MQFFTSFLFCVVCLTGVQADEYHSFAYVKIKVPRKTFIISNDFVLRHPHKKLNEAQHIANEFKMLLDSLGHLTYSRSQEIYFSTEKTKAKSLEVKNGIQKDYRNYGYKIIKLKGFNPGSIMYE